MPIYYGSRKIGAIYHGSRKIGKVYYGSTLVYESMTVVDHTFTSASVVNDNYTGDRLAVHSTNHYVRKNSSNGSGDVWYNTPLNSNDVKFEVEIGSSSYEHNQPTSLMIGHPDFYTYVEFSSSVGHLGSYNGSWSNHKDFGGISGLTTGDIIRLTYKREGSPRIALHRVRGSSTLTVATTSLAYQPARHLLTFGMSFRRDSNIFGTYYSPSVHRVHVEAR